jgi:hypothetical protein
MASLSAHEIFKYKWRYDLVKKKVKENSSFELNNRQKVLIKTFQEKEYDIAYAQKNAKALNAVQFTTAEGKNYTLKDFKKNKEEFGGGGGSGAGADLTKLTESAQALYCAAAWAGKKDFSPQSLLNSRRTVFCDAKIEDIIEKLPDDWVQSCSVGAKKLLSIYGSNKNLTFHRGSQWVNNLNTKFNTLNKTETKRPFSNINKWTPADIWLVDKSLVSNTTEINNAKTLTELNYYLLNMLDQKKIIGVSLKKIAGAGKTTILNHPTTVKKIYEYKGVTVGKTGFFDSGDGYIIYSDGEIQIRYFGATPSSWQGEIKGKTANQGKLGGGDLQKIMLKHTVAPLTTPNTIDALHSKFLQNDQSTIDKFYMYYKDLVLQPLPKDQFSSEIMKKAQKWFGSKFLTSELLYYLKRCKDPSKVVASILTYASSQSELSAPFCKLE